MLTRSPQTTLHRKIIYNFLDLSRPTLYKEIAHGVNFYEENNLYNVVACSLTGYNITEQSWLFLFSVASEVHLRLAGQQWTGVNIDWNRCIQ